MEGKTYLEILAQNDSEARQEYSENARDLLVEHNEYEDNVPPQEHHEDELEKQEDFQKFGGSRQLAGLRNIPEAKEIHKTSSNYDKQVRTHVLNVDSRFRKDTTDPSTNFDFLMLKKMKNVISVRLSSIEFPNVYYTFSRSRGNLSFSWFFSNVQTSTKLVNTVTIPEGNYDPPTLANTIQTLMNSKLSSSQFMVNFDPTSGKMIFSCSIKFTLDFQIGNYIAFVPRTFDHSLGYNLGFRDKSQYISIAKTDNNGIPLPLSLYTVTSDSIVDTIDNNYIFLSLDPDWKVVTNQSSDKNLHFSFAKIIINVGKGEVLYDNGANTLTKEFFFNQPSDISSFPVKVTDPYDQLINLNGMDFSFSLEFIEITSAGLYETMRE